MKIIALSDTHMMHEGLNTELNNLFNLYPDAILIHAGDALNSGSYKECNIFLNWFDKLPFKHKILVPGNHDISLDNTWLNRLPSYLGPTTAMFKYTHYNLDQIKKEFKTINVIINDIIEINGLQIGCISSIPDLRDWAFFADQRTRKILYENFPKCDILVSHHPFYTKDTIRYVYDGDIFLQNYLIDNDVKHFIHGHIHEWYGRTNYFGIDCYCVSICDEHYKPINKIAVIDL